MVAAPYHVNNTQDDVRIDIINAAAVAQGRQPLFACDDGRPSPCSRTDNARSIDDRVRDVGAILDAMPGWFGARVDAARAGVMGHSRGTLTALAAAGAAPLGGSAPSGACRQSWAWRYARAALTISVNLANVTVPTLLVAGGCDRNSRPAVSRRRSRNRQRRKAYVEIPNATHRAFDSTYCAQLQSAGAALDTNNDGVVTNGTNGTPDEITNTPAILDRHTVSLIAASPPGFLSGKAIYYCAPRFFTGPVNIEQLVAATPNAEYACLGAICSIAPPTVTPPVSACPSRQHNHSLHGPGDR